MAGELAIKTVCAMSGLPAGRDGDLMPNRVVSSWPECVYLHALETGSELRSGLARWIGYYNARR